MTNRDCYMMERQTRHRLRKEASDSGVRVSGMETREREDPSKSPTWISYPPRTGCQEKEGHCGKKKLLGPVCVSVKWPFAQAGAEPGHNLIWQPGVMSQKLPWNFAFQGSGCPCVTRRGTEGSFISGLGDRSREEVRCGEEIRWFAVTGLPMGLGCRSWNRTPNLGSEWIIRWGGLHKGHGICFIG